MTSPNGTPQDEAMLDSTPSSEISDLSTLTFRERIEELNAIEDLAVQALLHASKSVSALNPSSSETSAFVESSGSFLDVLEQLGARLKRNIRALEEEEVPLTPPTVRHDALSLTDTQLREMKHEL